MFKRLVLWLIHPLMIRISLKINRKQKCPACGVVQLHGIVWHTAYKKIMHKCKVCNAAWMTDPVCPVSKWQISLPKDPAMEEGVVEMMQRNQALMLDNIVQFKQPERVEKAK